jgi:hypothetical protein
MFTSTRPSFHRYQVAVDTGWPSRRSVVMTAGLGLRSMATAVSGSGGFGMRPSKLSCVDALVGIVPPSGCPTPADARTRTRVTVERVVFDPGEHGQTVESRALVR